MKICSRCKKNKSFSEFSKNKLTIDGYKNRCKGCDKKLSKDYYQKNKIRIRLNQKDHYQKNKIDILVRHREYKKQNKDKVFEYQKEYRSKNKDKMLEYQKEYQKKKYKENINYRLAKNLRNRLHKALQNNQKVGSAVKDLGCTIKELKVHLESNFQSGMVWDNWTINGWHIDHVKPLVNFDLTDRKQFLEACHYTNLCPLWAKENWSKGGCNE